MVHTCTKCKTGILRSESPAIYERFMTAMTEKEYLYISYLRLQYTCALGIGLWFAVTAYRRNSCIVIAIKFC